MTYKALHMVLNNFLNDSRVLKECKSINQKLKIYVTVFALHEKGLKTYEENDLLSINRFDLITRPLPKKKPIQLIKYSENWYRMYKKALYLRPDIVHAHDLKALPIGFTIARKLNIPLIYDAHEYETEQNGIKRQSVWHTGLKFIENAFIKKADKVITVSEGIALEYEKNYNVEKPVVIMNCPYYETVNKHDLFRQEFNISSDDLIFLYQGGLSEGRGLHQILEGFQSLDDRAKHLVVMGYGVFEPLVKEFAAINNNIHYKEAVKPDELLKWTSSADIGILTYENTCLNHYYCLPNKLFEYLMAGIPVIVSDLFELKKIVKHYNLGWVINENTPESLITVVDDIKKKDINVFKEGILQANDEFNWEEQEKILVKLYSDLLRI